MVIPRFNLNLNEINYPLLIAKALFISQKFGGYMERYETVKLRNKK